MGRLRKGIWVFNDESGEYDSPGIDGRTTKYREVLVDWLNRAFASSPADRDAAERIGVLVVNMNENTAEYLKAVDSWEEERKPKAIPFCKGLREIASEFAYEFEVDIAPRHGSNKWHIAFHCVTAPSGDAYERWQFLNENGQGPQALSEKWPGAPRRFNPECQAMNAVAFVALEGRLGTVKRCQIKECRRWFLTKDDCRVRYCRQHDSDDLRKGTPPRKKQLAAAQKKVREKAKTEGEKPWEQNGGEFGKPGRRRTSRK